VPSAGHIVDDAGCQRAAGGHGIAHALGHAGQMSGNMGIRCAQYQQAERQAESAALTNPQQYRPQP
jgi:hypothetical protein